MFRSGKLYISQSDGPSKVLPTGSMGLFTPPALRGVVLLHSKRIMSQLLKASALCLLVNCCHIHSGRSSFRQMEQRAGAGIDFGRVNEADCVVLTFVDGRDSVAHQTDLSEQKCRRDTCITLFIGLNQQETIAQSVGC